MSYESRGQETNVVIPDDNAQKPVPPLTDIPVCKARPPVQRSLPGHLLKLVELYAISRNKVTSLLVSSCTCCDAGTVT